MDIHAKRKMNELVIKAVDESCLCGGGGPDNCCAACMVWHRIYNKNLFKTRSRPLLPLEDDEERPTP